MISDRKEVIIIYFKSNNLFQQIKLLKDTNHNLEENLR